MHTKTIISWPHFSSSTMVSSDSVLSYENSAECTVVLWFEFVWAFPHYSGHSAQ
jgi:hypothetical protein